MIVLVAHPDLNCAFMPPPSVCGSLCPKATLKTSAFSRFKPPLCYLFAVPCSYTQVGDLQEGGIDLGFAFRDIAARCGAKKGRHTNETPFPLALIL